MKPTEAAVIALAKKYGHPQGGIFEFNYKSIQAFAVHLSAHQMQTATGDTPISEVLWAAILGAVARGWCHEKNAHKTMDSDLAVAIGEEIKALFAQQAKSTVDATGVTKDLLQQALDALIECRHATTDKSERDADATIVAIRAAIAQPIQPEVNGWPKASPKDVQGGWTLDAAFLNAIAQTIDDGVISMEEVESVNPSAASTASHAARGDRR